MSLSPFLPEEIPIGCTEFGTGISPLLRTFQLAPYADDYGESGIRFGSFLLEDDVVYPRMVSTVKEMLPGLYLRLISAIEHQADCLLPLRLGQCLEQLAGTLGHPLVDTLEHHTPIARLRPMKLRTVAIKKGAHA